MTDKIEKEKETQGDGGTLCFYRIPSGLPCVLWTLDPLSCKSPLGLQTRLTLWHVLISWYLGGVALVSRYYFLLPTSSNVSQKVLSRSS